MKLNDALKIIGEADKKASFPADWLSKDFSECDSFSLEPEKIDWIATYCTMDKQTREAMLAASRLAAGSEAVRTVCRAFFHAAFLDSVSRLKAPVVDFIPVDGKLSGALRLLVVTGVVPLMRAMHRRGNIPEVLTRETAGMFAAAAQRYLDTHGIPGIAPSTFEWFRHYLDSTNPYLRIGRFAYIPTLLTADNPLQPFAWMFRHRHSGEWKIFAKAGLCFDRNGLALDADEDATDFRSEFSQKNGVVSGYAVNQNGRTVREPEVWRPDADWELCCGNTPVPVLDFHIPSGGAMTPEVVADSLRRALEFFDAFSTSARPRAFICNSWLFNPELPEILPPNSNILSLQRTGRLIPLHSSPDAGLTFITGQDRFDLSTAPRRTSLERSILDWIQSGRRWRGGGFILWRGINNFFAD